MRAPRSSGSSNSAGCVPWPASGRAFHQVWTGVSDDSPEKTSLKVVSTERRKLRPLLELGQETGDLSQTAAPHIATHEI